MTRFQFYIFRQLFGMFALVTLSCVTVGILVRGLGIILDAASKGFPASLAGYGLIVLIPSILLVVVPFALFVAIAMIYDKLARDCELLSMRIVGVSSLALTLPALGLGLAAAALCFVTAIWLLPASRAEWRALKSLRNAAAFNLTVEPGLPRTLVPGLTILVRQSSAGRVLKGVVILDERQAGRKVTILAREGTLVVDHGRLLIRFADGRVQTLQGAVGRRETTIFKLLNYPIQKTASWTIGGAAQREPSIRELLNPPAAVNRNSVRYRNMLADGHLRLTAPAGCITIALLTVAILFVGLHDRQSRRRRVVVCASVTAGLVLAQYGFQRLAIQSSAMLPLLYLNVLIPGVIAVMLLRSRRLFQT